MHTIRYFRHFYVRRHICRVSNIDLVRFRDPNDLSKCLMVDFRSVPVRFALPSNVVVRSRCRYVYFHLNIRWDQNFEPESHFKSKCSLYPAHREATHHTHIAKFIPNIWLYNACGTRESRKCAVYSECVAACGVWRVWAVPHTHNTDATHISYRNRRWEMAKLCDLYATQSRSQNLNHP